MATEHTVTMEYPGARVTRLVGRHDVLETIEAAVQDRSGQTYVFYIEAEGGMGKTFLARHVLKLCQARDQWGAPDLLAARHELDFYHYQTRSQEGFMTSFVEEMGKGLGCFSEYYEEYQRAQKRKFEDIGAIFEPERAELTHKFLQACNMQSQHKRMVVVLDTVERLVYETDRIQQALELDEQVAGLRHWLLTRWLPAMRNAVILVCGRPPKPSLDTVESALQEAAKACQARFQRLPLHDFDPEETEDYLKAVRETAEQDVNQRASKRLESISADSRRMIYRLTGGRPITLAIIVDYYLATGQLVDAIKDAMSKESLSEDQEHDLRQQVQGDVVRLYRELERPADETLLAMAWTPMGLDAELLSAVTGQPRSEAESILTALANPRQGLSFVKIRDGRVFLHDEMYDLLWEYVLRTEPGHEQVYDRILTIYGQRIRDQQKEIGRLRQLLPRQPLLTDSSHLTEGEELIPVTVDPWQLEEIAEAHATLDVLQVEEIYYLLRRDPARGFAQYAEYAQAAVMDHNEALDMQLRDQMFGFMREAAERGYDRRGVERDVVERDSALRWGWSLLYKADVDQAERLVKYVQEHEQAFIDAGGPLAQAELDVINGWVAAHLGEEMAAAEERLKGAIDTITGLKINGDHARRRLRNVRLAQAYNVMGYLLRVQGRFDEACGFYRQAPPLWRDLEREADHAEALNNLSYAMTMTGNYRRALRVCWDGLELREKVGYLHPVALSRNTLGLIEIMNDQPHRGLVHCHEAFVTFRYLGTARGVGLACTALAEAYRRSAGVRRGYPKKLQIERLEESEKYAQEAVNIFEGESAKGTERLRRVEALIELGCATRNLAGMYVEDNPELCRALTGKSEQALNKAADLAGETLRYRQVDALTNLAWLYFYVHRQADAERALDKALRSVPKGYEITKAGGMPRVDKPIPFFWVQLAKMHALSAQMAMQGYWDTKVPTKGDVRDEGTLRRAIADYVLALEYGILFAEDYRDLRKLKDNLYDQASKANIAEFRIIYDAIAQTAREYQIAGPKSPRLANFLIENFGPLEAMGRDQD